MSGVGLLSLIFGLMTGLGIIEDRRHRANLARLKTRVHVNGTRGKSSVTRLIGAGLRAGGVTTCAKTTGTLARMILPDGSEVPVFRPAKANIREQIRIVRTAAQVNAEALVIECMALQPYLQWLSESRFVQATHAVITNARPDHLDVMGPTEVDVALALAGMVPKKGRLYTAERDHLDVFRRACDDRKCELFAIGEAEVAAISAADLDGFLYREHPDNLALALRVCADLGIDRAVALAGMWTAQPDPGAMTEHLIEFFGRRVVFVNGFAANDPESTRYIWEQAMDRHPQVERRIAVFNCRADRADRSRQLGEDYVRWKQADHVVLMGTGTYMFARAAVQAGLEPRRIVYAEDIGVDDIFETIIGLAGRAALVMGMGNIGGQGLDVVRYFRNREVLES
ncbi:MAG: poly-gamma-glutamate synthase PgsB [Myxococcales bacterium]|nr:poly-gamma-glutamate synthase PgsB [Myxococcales bacterium]